MGAMPFHLEKGVLGLRMDYLSRSPAVRAHVVKRLQAGQDPFEVAASIDIPGVGVINVFTDRKADFVAKLDALKRRTRLLTTAMRGVPATTTGKTRCI